MTTLFVRAHWTGRGKPVPASLATYGTPPSISAPPPAWPPGGPAPTYEVWVPLVRQADLDAAQWGVNTVPAPPPWPPASGAPAGTFDLGYSQQAAGFRVTGVRLWQDGPPGTDFTYRVIPPSGPPIVSVTPTGPGWTPLPLVAPIPDGTGIWVIQVDRAAGSSVAEPGLCTGSTPPSGVREPYVSPYGGCPSEGVLGLELTGDEIPPPTTTTSTTTTTTTTTPPPCCYSLGLNYQAPCAQGSNPVSIQFNLTITPGPGCPPYAGTVTWKIKRITPGPAQYVQIVTKTGPGSDTHTYPSFTQGDWGVEAVCHAPNCPDDQTPTAFDQFSIPDCNCPTLTGNIQPTATSDPCVWNFNVLVNNPRNLPLQFDWDFGDGVTATTTTASTSHTYTTSGTMTVRVTLTSPGTPACQDSRSIPVTVNCVPTTPTTTTTTTPGPTTSPPTTTTTTTTPGPTTSPPTTTPPSGGGCCLCLLLIIAALALIALAAIAVFAWACGGFLNVPLLVVGIVAAIIGIVLLIVWILLCRSCAEILFLIGMFTVLVAIMALVAILLFLLGLVTCGIGALIDCGFFAVVLAVLNAFGAIVGCVAARVRMNQRFR